MCVAVHQRNLQILEIEIYKGVNNLSSSVMSELFKKKENSNGFRRKDTLAVRKIWTTRYEIDRVYFLGPKIMDLIPLDIKESRSLTISKNRIKDWVPSNCPCTLCKEYIPNLGYI